MANTYWQIYIHLVFGVKCRASMINPKWQSELHRYMCGIIENLGCRCLRIGGVSDHVHVLIACPPKIALADVVQSVKQSSSKWVNTVHARGFKFYWQEGYGAFSLHRNRLEDLMAYIDNQAIHHGRFSFVDEYRAILRKNGVEFKEEYILTAPQ